MRSSGAGGAPSAETIVHPSARFIDNRRRTGEPVALSPSVQAELAPEPGRRTREEGREVGARVHHRPWQAGARAAQHRGLPAARGTGPQPGGGAVHAGSGGHRLRSPGRPHRRPFARSFLSELRKLVDGKADVRVAAWVSGRDAASFHISALSLMELETGVRMTICARYVKRGIM